MASAPQKRKQGPGGPGGSSHKKSKGGNASKWKTSNHNAKMAEKVEMGTALAVGDEGIWVTFARGMDSKAKRELITLCEEFGESLYGIKPPNDEQEDEKDEDADKDEGLDIEASIQKELESLRSTKPKSRRVFTIVRTDIECVFFVKTMKPVDPIELVLKICEEAEACSDPMKRRTRYINRLTPVTNTEKATENGIVRVARSEMAPHFSLIDEAADTKSEIGDAATIPDDTSKPSDAAEKPKHTYAVRHSVRAHQQLKSDAIIKLVASTARPEHHKVNLSKPDKVVLVEVFKMFCGISVVDGSDWERFKKFNVNELYRLTTAKEPAKEVEGTEG